MFPTRDQIAEHVEHHAQEEGVELQLGTSVERIDREDGTWVLRTSDGDLRTQQVIVATGLEHTPFIPEWRGRESFGGGLLHSRDYRNPEPFEDSAVLVVGVGSSGMEIAHDLATGGAAKVWLSARTPPNITPREGPGGFPADVIAVSLLRFPTRFGDAVARFGRRIQFGDLTRYGLPVPDEGVYTRMYRLGVAPAILDKEVIEAIKGGQIKVVRGVESLDENGAQLSDGERVEPDVIICATGYRRGLEPLVGHLGVLDELGRPRAVDERPAAGGLRFLGYVPRPGALGYAAKQAKRAAKAIARELRH
jgi:cation diffusion facilitator CzcD-associated flavoprotein CzcO